MLSVGKAWLARAIENLAYVIAAGQYGDHPDRRATYGQSMIVDPWGQIFAALAEGDGHVAADIVTARLEELSADFPVGSYRRL